MFAYVSVWKSASISLAGYFLAPHYFSILSYLFSYIRMLWYRARLFESAMYPDTFLYLWLVYTSQRDSGRTRGGFWFNLSGSHCSILFLTRYRKLFIWKVTDSKIATRASIVPPDENASCEPKSTPRRTPAYHVLVSSYYAVVIYFQFKNKVKLASSPFQEPGERNKSQTKKTPVLHWFDFLAMN